MISITYFSFAALLFVLNYFYIWNKYSRITRIWIVSLPTWLICLLAKWASLEHENDTNNSLNYSSSFSSSPSLSFSYSSVCHVTPGDVRGWRSPRIYSTVVLRAKIHHSMRMLCFNVGLLMDNYANRSHWLLYPSLHPPHPPPSSNSVKGSLWEGFELPRGTLTSYPDQLGVWNKLM